MTARLRTNTARVTGPGSSAPIVVVSTVLTTAAGPYARAFVTAVEPAIAVPLHRLH